MNDGLQGKGPLFVIFIQSTSSSLLCNRCVLEIVSGSYTCTKEFQTPNFHVRKLCFEIALI